MNIVAFIPVRSGSSLKDKNIYPLGGYPLLAWSIATAKQSCHIKDVYVYTDSTKYSQIGCYYGAQTIWDDNPNIGKVPNHVFLRDCQKTIEYDEHIDFIVVLWATTPLREAQYVDDAVTGFLVKSDKATSLKSVVKMSESAYKAMKLDNGWLISLNGDTANIPRQQIPETYHPNGYVDIIRGDVIREGKGWGDKVLPFLCDDVGEIDTEADIKNVERLLKDGVGGTTYQYLRDNYPIK